MRRASSIDSSARSSGLAIQQSIKCVKNLKTTRTLHGIGLCLDGSSVGLPMNYLGSRFVSVPVALLLLAGIAPPGLRAGSEPFDNSGRLPCDANGRITLSGLEAQMQRPSAELLPGAMVTVPAVCPAERYFPTGVLLTPGATYQIDAQGRWQDGWIRIGPNGWPGLMLEAWNRLPWKRFFLLGGAIGRSEAHQFPIGQSRRWSAPSTLSQGDKSELYLFANDWPGMLHNNRSVPVDKGGPLRVSITRLP